MNLHLRLRPRLLFERRQRWSVGIYKLESKREIFNLELHQPICVIGEKGLRKDREYQTTVADPFLFTDGGILYLFYEVQTNFGHGELWAQFLSESGEWVCLGKVLGEQFHLSYPQVFKHNGKIYMLPESAESGSVLLYEAVRFPVEWAVFATIVKEPLLDPTLFIGGDQNFLIFGTTINHELKLYRSGSLMGPFCSNEAVISADKSVSRCAGGILEVDGSLYRLAQDCSRIYGERVRLLKINNMTDSYSEELSIPDLFLTKPEWMSTGGHHLSVCEFGGAIYAAVDGQSKDRYLNTLLLAVLKLFNLIFRRRNSGAG